MRHRCHHPTCNNVVPPNLLACKPHWFQLPDSIRNEIWRTYRSGQEIDKRPSAAYIAAFKEAERYWLGQMANKSRCNLPLFESIAE